MIHVVIEQAGSIVQRIAVEMAHAYQHLDWVAQGVSLCSQIHNHEA